MDLSHAQQLFRDLLHNIDGNHSLTFLRWVKETTESALNEAAEPSAEKVILGEIQEDLRRTLPLTTVLQSENIIYPTHGQNADCTAASTIHVDGFLYNDDLIEDLVEDGKLTRNYCKQCGSHQVAPLTFLSHSTSMSQLEYIFRYLLPDLRGKILVDVGSRLGPVLYGAYLYTGASRIIGVEMNSDLCQIQQKVVEKYHMQDRIQIICDDVCNHSELLANVDVLVMNNVFEFFVDTEKQKKIWEFIQKTVRKPGSLLVVSPSLETSLQPLQLLELLSGWVEPVTRSEVLLAAERTLFSHPSDSDLNDIYLYTVL